jgi:hypothetical protein
MWDRALELGGAITLSMCREGGFRCTRGTLRLTNTELAFTDEEGTHLFVVTPAQVGLVAVETPNVLFAGSIGRLRLRLGTNNYNFDFMPEGMTDCRRGVVFYCSETAGLRQQEEVAEYLATTIRRLGEQDPGN